MTVSKRIILQLMLAIVAIVGIGAYNQYTQAQVSKLAINFATNDYPSIITLNKFANKFAKLRLSTVLYLTASSPSEQQQVKSAADDNYRQSQAAIAEYESMINDDQDKALFNKDKELLAAYYTAYQLMFSVAEQHDLEQAKKVRHDKVSPIAADLQKIIEDHTEYNQRYVQVELDNAQREITQARWISFAFGGVVTVLLLISGFRSYKAIVTPLNELQQTMAHIGQSLDFTRQVKIYNAHDELGMTASTFNQLIGRLRESLSTIVGNCNKVVGYTQDLTVAAKQVAQAASKQHEASSSIAATVEQVTVSINHVGDRAQSTSQKTSEANELAQSGQQVINLTVEEIRGISSTVLQTSEKLSLLEVQNGKIALSVSSIKDIAEQTNLLALNAAIEAARAGEQGRGFAVVADEVRKLAERTSQLTTDIDLVIRGVTDTSQQSIAAMSDTRKRVEKGVQMADEAMVSIASIGSSSTEALRMVNDIADSIREQASASNTIALQVEQIAQMAEQSSAAATETSNTVEQLDETVLVMNKAVSLYKI